MSILQKRRVRTLPEWLEIATRKLTDASKERIRVEIEAHYAEAMEAHRDNGLSEADAQTKALAELGDAKAATRRFRKQHLTEREDQRLKTSEKMARSILLLLASYMFCAGLASDQFPLRQHALAHFPCGALGLALEFVLLIALPTVCFVIARRANAKFKRHLLLTQPASGVFAGMLFNALFTKDISSYHHWLWFLVAFVLFLQFLYHFRIWIKLGKAGMILNHAPPPDTAPI